MKTALTALVSAVIGGLVTALFIFVGMFWVGNGSGNVTIKEASPPVSGKGVSGNSSQSSVRQVYTRDGPGVVSVEVASGRGPGGGSGFVLDESGHIVTNQHVVEAADGVSVQFANGTRKEAEVIGEDPSTDLAVIKVDAPEESLRPLTFGDSDALKVGEPVIAIGNPLNVGISVTTGIVSGVGRPIKAPNNYTISEAVQTDAAINPGNSGGPLLDSRGTVVGVNSQIISDTGSFQGVGFAIPSNTVKSVVEQLITNGDVEHGYIGVSMFTAGIEELVAYTGLSEKELREEHGLPPTGAIVSEVMEDGPADKAGIKGGEEKEIKGLPVPMGDVITAADGEKVSTPDDVIRIVNSLEPGERVKLTVVSPGQEPREVEVELGVQPDGV
ncbi:MAG: trypsin-like peptidase domain-containing protein [Actinomycetota bacterium]|nr:trypsin-like peptidase domain-containing protein [Actinomycetota bacterium]